LVEREYNSGHTVAVHSYTHEYSKIYSSPQNLLNDINACNKLIYEITGEYSNVYRFPGGSFGLSSELISAVCEKGMRYVDWNASTRDAEIWNATPDQIVNAAISTSSDFNNVVLLAHDSTTKITTAQALRRIIRYYKDNNYVFDRF
jgi:peptidoglycan/xylan/chitin deacetylase (PgdA/CDA1 family)